MVRREKIIKVPVAALDHFRRGNPGGAIVLWLSGLEPPRTQKDLGLHASTVSAKLRGAISWTEKELSGVFEILGSCPLSAHAEENSSSVTLDRLLGWCGERRKGRRWFPSRERSVLYTPLAKEEHERIEQTQSALREALLALGAALQPRVPPEQIRELVKGIVTVWSKEVYKSDWPPEPKDVRDWPQDQKMMCNICNDFVTPTLKRCCPNCYLYSSVWHSDDDLSRKNEG